MPQPRSAPRSPNRKLRLPVNRPAESPLERGEGRGGRLLLARVPLHPSARPAPDSSPSRGSLSDRYVVLSHSDFPIGPCRPSPETPNNTIHLNYPSFSPRENAPVIPALSPGFGSRFSRSALRSASISVSAFSDPWSMT